MEIVIIFVGYNNIKFIRATEVTVPLLSQGWRRRRIRRSLKRGLGGRIDKNYSLSEVGIETTRFFLTLRYPKRLKEEVDNWDERLTTIAQKRVEE